MKTALIIIGVAAVALIVAKSLKKKKPSDTYNYK